MFAEHLPWCRGFRRSGRPRQRRGVAAGALLLALVLTAAACGASDAEESAAAGPAVDKPEDAGAEGEEDGEQNTKIETADAEPGAFPVEVATSSGTVTVKAAPATIVSLSSTATEILFAIGAGDRVVAVDKASDYPEEAPQGTLDSFAPDLEAILAFSPDLVVTSGLPEAVSLGLEENGIPVIFQPAAANFDETYDQVTQLGQATGEVSGAASVNAEMRSGIDAVLARLPESETPVRVFHEIDDSFYTATSASFIGQVYAKMGFENIADPLDDGSGFPLVEAESIIAADPTLIVFTDKASYDAEDIAARPGWEATAAVAQGQIVQVDAEISSRWGPRIVEFMATIADALTDTDTAE